MKERKRSNTKSNRLESEIVDLLNNTSLSCSEIGDNLGLSKSSIKRIGKLNNISEDRLKIRRPHSARKAKRNENIIKMINDDVTYAEISKKYKITKQRVYQIAIEAGIFKFDVIKSRKEDIVKLVDSYIEEGLSYKEIADKHKGELRRVKAIYLELKGVSLGQFFREKRNNLIVELFESGMTASEILNLDNKIITGVGSLQDERQIYAICTKQGVKRHPNVGSRVMGGNFDDKKVQRYIINKRDKENWGFKKITEGLNKLNYTTSTGIEFKVPNVSMKYRLIKKNKNKV